MLAASLAGVVFEGLLDWVWSGGFAAIAALVCFEIGVLEAVMVTGEEEKRCMVLLT